MVFQLRDILTHSVIMIAGTQAEARLYREEHKLESTTYVWAVWP